MPRFLVIFTCLALAGCGSNDKPVESTRVIPPPPQKTVIDTQLKALEKAKAVQDVIDKDAADTQKKIDDAGG